jgi:hypothetical protein
MPGLGRPEAVELPEGRDRKLTWIAPSDFGETTQLLCKGDAKEAIRDEERARRE